jgi:hypothetical protein
MGQNIPLGIEMRYNTYDLSACNPYRLGEDLRRP